MNLDRLLKLGQILALVVVPIWVLSELSTANKLLASRMDEMSRVQAATVEQLAKLGGIVEVHSETLAIQKGIRMGIEEAARRK